MVGVSSIGHPKDIGIHSQRIMLRDATDKTPLQPTRLLLVTWNNTSLHQLPKQWIKDSASCTQVWDAREL